MGGGGIYERKKEKKKMAEFQKHRRNVYDLYFGLGLKKIRDETDDL